MLAFQKTMSTFLERDTFDGVCTYSRLKFDLQIFPIKSELLKPQEEMERHITGLIKKVRISIHFLYLSVLLYFLLFVNVHQFWAAYFPLWRVIYSQLTAVLDVLATMAVLGRCDWS